MAPKTSAALTVVLLVTTLLVSNLPSAASQNDYSEEISVTIIGRSAYWSIDMKGNGVSIEGLPGIEKEIGGVSSYRLLLMDSSRWSPEFELFSQAGYDLLGFDTIPSSGIFLKVRADGSEAAERFADSVSRLLHLKFTRFSSTDGFYTFYSHMDFDLVKGDLWSAVPVGNGGSATLVDQDTFLSQDIPIFKFSGVVAGDEFIHTVTLAGLKRDAVSSKATFKLADLFPKIATTNASSTASSSTIVVRTIGSFVSYTEEGKSTNFPENRSAIITAPVEPGAVFPPISVELAQTFPSVIATRTVDRAALNQGDVMTVGIRVKNAAPLGSVPVGNITVSDEWWRDRADFEFVDGETSRTLGHLAPDGEFTLAYRLRLVSPDRGEVVAPPSRVVYSYEIEGGEVEESVAMNPLTLVLNDIRPAISVEASIEPIAHPIFGPIPVNLTIRNHGNGHATDLEVEGHSRQSLLSGDTWRLTVDLPPSSLTDLAASGTWSVTWDEGGQRKEATSNGINVYYNLTGAAIPRFDVVRSIVPTVKNGEHLVKETVSIINRGAGLLERVSLRGTLPNSFSILEGNYTLQGDILSAEANGIQTNGSVTYGYSAVVTDPDENYIIQPTEIVVEASGLKLNRLTRSSVLPLGVEVFKSFEPVASFVSGNATIDAEVVNKGSIPVFDVAFSVGADSFLKIVEGESTFTKDVLGKDESLGSRNRITLLSVGQFEASKAEATFTIAGHIVTKSSETVQVEVYRPVSVKITIKPSSPIENQEFTAVLTVRNPSEVQVQDIDVNIALPPEVRVTAGSLGFTADELDANTTITREATLIADAPLDLLIPQPTVSFRYGTGTFRGESTPIQLSIRDNLVSRYGIPLTIAALLTLATAFIARRAVVPSKAA